ncbi:MAG: hypothetical protein ABI181_04155, partial [Mycobacteriaceae bacterium]
MAPDSDPDTLTRTDAQRRSDAVSSPVVRRYVGGLATLTLALSAVQVWLEASAPGRQDWLLGLPILAVAFLLSETYPLEVEVRGGNIAIPLIEVPLLVALLLVPFPVAGVAVVLAIATRAIKLRQHRVIAAYNFGAGLSEVVVVYLARDALNGVFGERLPELVLLFVALVLSSLAGSLNTLGLTLAVSGRQERSGRDQLA